MKRYLQKIIGKAKINCEEVNTVIRNIENVLNNRLLTLCSDNFTTPLVPNHLIYRLKINNVNINDNTTNYNESVTETRTYKKYVQYLIDTEAMASRITYENYVKNNRNIRDRIRNTKYQQMILCCSKKNM